MLKRISSNVDKELYANLEIIADKTHTTMSNLIRVVMAEFVRQHIEKLRAEHVKVWQKWINGE